MSASKIGSSVQQLLRPTHFQVQPGASRAGGVGGSAKPASNLMTMHAPTAPAPGGDYVQGKIGGRSGFHIGGGLHSIFRDGFDHHHGRSGRAPGYIAHTCGLHAPTAPAPGGDLFF